MHDTIIDLFRVGMARDIPNLRPMPTGTKLNLGAGKKLIAGSIALDYPDWDADHHRIPFQDGVISGIHCYHFLEHVRQPILMLEEFQRVLRPGGVVNIVVPYYTSQMQAQDLDHKHCFCETTWDNIFANKYYKKYPVDWQFEVGTNIIIGIVERNVCLMTQLIRK